MLDNIRIEHMQEKSSNEIDWVHDFRRKKNLSYGEIFNSIFLKKVLEKNNIFVFMVTILEYRYWLQVNKCNKWYSITKFNILTTYSISSTE